MAAYQLNLQNKLPIVINSLMLFYAFLLPLSKAGINIVSALMIILFLFDKNIKKYITMLISNKIIIAILLFLSFSVISLLWTNDISNGLKELKTYFHFFPIIIFIIYLKEEQIFSLISAFLLAVFISEIFSYGVFFELWIVGNATPSNPSPFMHHIQYSMLLAFSSLLLLNKLFFETNIKLRILYFIYFITVTVNLFINGGRTGQMAFIISIFILGFLNVKNKILAFISILLITIIILVTAYNTSPVFYSRTNLASAELTKLFTNSKDKFDGSLGNRVAIWIESKRLMKENPIIGTGIGCELSSLVDTIDINSKKYTAIIGINHYHNNYISYMVQLGLIGLILYLNIFYQIYKLSIKNKELSNIKYIFLSIFSIVSLMDFTFTLQFPIAFFAIYIGIFIVAHNKENQLNQTFGDYNTHA